MNSVRAETAAALPIDVAAKLHELARAKSGSAPVISVYLDTRWSDEHQRDRARIFLKSGIRKAAALDTVLVSAGGSGRVAVGVEATIDAVNRSTVNRLYLLATSWEDGRSCSACHALQRAEEVVCRWCGATTGALELGEAMVQRVLAAGGDIASIDVHAGLERAGGIAALLRYLPRG